MVSTRPRPIVRDGLGDSYWKIKRLPVELTNEIDMRVRSLCRSSYLHSPLREPRWSTSLMFGRSCQPWHPGTSH